MSDVGIGAAVPRMRCQREPTRPNASPPMGRRREHPGATGTVGNGGRRIPYRPRLDGGPRERAGRGESDSHRGHGPRQLDGPNGQHHRCRPPTAKTRLDSQGPLVRHCWRSDQRRLTAAAGMSCSRRPCASSAFRSSRASSCLRSAVEHALGELRIRFRWTEDDAIGTRSSRPSDCRMVPSLCRVRTSRETLDGERLHQWIGARRSADTPPPRLPDLDRIRRQQTLVQTAGGRIRLHQGAR